MIAAVFVLVLALVIGVSSLMGGGAAVQVSQSVPWWALVCVVLAFVAFFAGGVYIGAALAVLALLAGFGLSDRPFWNFIGEMLWAPSTNFVLVSVPLFLLMGEIMLRAGLSDRLYRALNVWVGRLPGGLLHTNIMSCGVFSAIAGSSVATAATMGSVALPYFEKSNYPPKLVLGSLAAGGALGNLIPPGITFIIYGLITETSVGALYLAAIGPSVLVIVLFLAVIFYYSIKLKISAENSTTLTLSAKLLSLIDLFPTLLLIGLVLGTIYAGWATPTEAAALGALSVVVLAACYGEMTWSAWVKSLEGALRITVMSFLIIFGSATFAQILAFTGASSGLMSWALSFELTPMGMLMIMLAMILFLGCFMDQLSMMLLTAPIFFPLAKTLGFDLTWFGLIMLLALEIGYTTPPFGLLLFVMKGVAPPETTMKDIYLAAMPFIGCVLLLIAMIIVFPPLATWLPKLSH